MLEALFVALLVGFAVQALGAKGEPVLNFVTVLQRLVFKILAGIMWLAPIGAFGAIAGVVGNAGWAAIGALGMFVAVFYATCVVFIVVILGALLKVTTGFSIFKVLYYLRQEYLLIVATSSSETALPRLIAKMEHLGRVQARRRHRRAHRLLVQPGRHRDVPDDGVAVHQQRPGHAADLVRAALPAGLHDRRVQGRGRGHRRRPGRPRRRPGLTRPGLVPGVGLIVAVDRFMSEARALTNFSGNAVATLVIAHWVKEIDHDQANRVFSGEDPFDDTDMLDEHSAAEHRADVESYKNKELTH